MDVKDEKSSLVEDGIPTDAFELSIMNTNGPQPDEKVDDTSTPYRLTFKHAMVLFSLTLLWLSAAGPVFFITASIGRFADFAT
jgi:hypothetical protein